MGLFPFFHHSHWIRRCPSSYYHPHPTSNSSCRTVLWRRMRSSSSSTQSSTVSSTKLSPYDEDYFMKQVEATVTKVLRRHPHFHAPTYNALLKTLMRKKKDDTNDNNDEEDDDAATSITNIHTYLNGLKITDIVGPPLTDEDTTANHNNTAKKENSTHKQHREAFGIARHLQKRLLKLRRSGDCPRCWMKREYCICARCQFETARRTDPETSTADADTDSNRSSSDINSDPGPETSSSSSSGSVAVLDRIFVLMHHKEIGMKVDTAKLILGAFPAHGQLVIGGMEDPSDQDSMRILADSIQDPTRTSLILFPHETATTIEDILAQQQEQEQEQQQQQPDATKNSTNTHDHHRRHNNDQYYDLVVLDGTWSQARKLQARYCTATSSAASSAAIRYVQLNPDSVQRLQQPEEDDDDDVTSSSAVSTTRTTGEGGGHGNLHQLRKHTIPWRQVGTFAAFRLFLHEWSSVPTNTTMTTTTATTMATTTATTTTTSTANNQYNNYGTNQHENPYNHRMRNICQTIESYQRISNAAVLREKGRT